MARPRFTVTDLRNTVDECNDGLREIGSTRRYIANGRNGYQAVDAYSVDEAGERIGSGVDYNVGCGTSREVADYVRTDYYNECHRLELLAKDNEIARLTALVDA